jgi:predicted nuclease of predicted toxin-antitoxin system
MRLYLDDDSAEKLLVRLLEQAGHDVQIPADVGLSGTADPLHLSHAIRDDRVLLTRNDGDFRILHNLIAAAQGHHPGILVVRLANRQMRDLRPAGIVRAIGNLLAAGIPIPDGLHVLTQWR